MPAVAPPHSRRPRAPCADRDGIVPIEMTHIDHAPMTNTSIYHLKFDKFRGALHLAERSRREATSCSAYSRSLLKPGLKVRAVVETIPDAAMLRALS